MGASRAHWRAQQRPGETGGGCKRDREAHVEFAYISLRTAARASRQAVLCSPKTGTPCDTTGTTPKWKVTFQKRKLFKRVFLHQTHLWDHFFFE